jgi:hypothetical protein
VDRVVVSDSSGSWCVAGGGVCSLFAATAPATIIIIIWRKIWNSWNLWKQAGDDGMTKSLDSAIKKFEFLNFGTSHSGIR